MFDNFMDWEQDEAQHHPGARRHNKLYEGWEWIGGQNETHFKEKKFIQLKVLLLFKVKNECFEMTQKEK